MELSKGNSFELTGLPRDVLEVVLYYVYSQSLPLELTTEVASRCIDLTPSFLTNEFPDMCREFIHRTSLKHSEFFIDDQGSSDGIYERTVLLNFLICLFRNHTTGQ